MAALFAVRTVNEERVLASGLPGYSDYLTQVRFRLLPGVW
jgi:protein-S-isoprenylcysteine O-methyltransferase Ste14